jgi:hypothetical protein
VINAEYKSSLEWLFSTPSAANFPQPLTSPALSNLQRTFSNLADDYLKALVIKDEAHNESLLAVYKSSLQLAQAILTGMDSDKAFELLRLVRQLGEGVGKLSDIQSEPYTGIILTFRNVLADLIIYAKESRDYTFKKGVLDLVRTFDSQEPIGSLSRPSEPLPEI